MNRPSFQFYPGDWTANPNLKRCTFAEKGIWLEVICLMHDQDEYGVLRWPLKEIAEAVKCRAADLLALARKGVLKGDDKHLSEPFIYVPRSGRKDGEPVTLIDTQAGPIWYSSRMVKDEYVRTIRGDQTRFGAAKGEAPKPSPKPPLSDGASSSSSSSGKPKTIPTSSDVPSTSKPSSIWDLGQQLLGSRAFVTHLIKDYGESAVTAGIAELSTLSVNDPRAWIKGKLNGIHRGSAPSGGRGSSAAERNASTIAGLTGSPSDPGGTVVEGVAERVD